MALRDKFIAMRDHFWPCEVVYGLARRSYHYILLHKGGSANPLSLLHRYRAVSWCYQSIAFEEFLILVKG